MGINDEGLRGIAGSPSFCKGVRARPMMERNGPNCKPGQTTPKRELTRFWARGPKSHFRRGVIHLQPPTLGGCHPSELPHRTPNQPKLIRVLLVAARADRLLTYKPKNGPYRARGLKSQMSRGVIHLQPPTLGGFHPSELPHRNPNHPKLVCVLLVAAGADRLSTSEPKNGAYLGLEGSNPIFEGG